MQSERARSYPFIPAQPLLNIVGGEGDYLITDDGRRILDGAGGAIVNNIGYGRPEIAEAAAASLTGTGYTLPTFATETRLRLIERVTQHWLPDGMTRCMFVTGGSESVDTAVRVARQYQVACGRTSKWKVLGRSTSYHGSTLAALSVGNHDRRRSGMEPMLMDLPKVDLVDADLVIKTIEAEDPDTVSALIMEPVVGAAGAAIVVPDDYWPTLRSYCTDNNIVLIADEVMTGFGRTGTNFGVDHWNVTPDLLVSGKGLGGGYVPIGGLFATDAFVEPLAGQQIMYFTFSGSDVTCAVADKVLQIMQDEHLVERCAEMGERFASMLDERLTDHPHVADIRGMGLMRGIELVRDRSTGASFDGALTPLVVAAALERDTWIYPAGSAGVPDGLLFGPSFAIAESDLERLADVALESIDTAVERFGQL